MLQIMLKLFYIEGDFCAEYVHFNSGFKGCSLAETTCGVFSASQQPLKQELSVDNLDTENPFLYNIL